MLFSLPSYLKEFFHPFIYHVLDSDEAQREQRDRHIATCLRAETREKSKNKNKHANENHLPYRLAESTFMQTSTTLYHSAIAAIAE
jgi:hypothetical protein